MKKKKRATADEIASWLDRIGRKVEQTVSVEFKIEKFSPRDSRAPRLFRGSESPGLRGPTPAPNAPPGPDVPPGVKVIHSPLGTELWQYEDGRVVNPVEAKEISRAFWEDTRELMAINIARAKQGLSPFGTLREALKPPPPYRYWPP